MLPWSKLRVPGESVLRCNRAGDVCDDPDYDRAGECAVRGAVEHSRVRVLPERSNDRMPGLCGRHRNTAAETRQDGDNGGVAVVRHERRRDTGCDDRAWKRNASELQPDNGSGEHVGVVWYDKFERGRGSMLGRTGSDKGDDDVH